MTMTLAERIRAFATLGQELARSPDFISDERVRLENPWFTTDNVRLAIGGIISFLDHDRLQSWTSRYSLERAIPKKIGVVMAGNIPLVGFHDLLVVLLAGHHLKVKVSSQDSVLMRHIADQLLSIEPRFAGAVAFEERLAGIDAVIATGSTNTARYFDYYFRSIPHIIRKNRASCAILSGNETAEERAALGTDVFSYFGLGCRNVSKLYVPAGYDFPTLINSWASHESVIRHTQYGHNYDYQKSIFLVNQIPFFDNGFILLKEEVNLVSPVAVLFFEYYRDTGELSAALEAQAGKIQCLVSSDQRKGSVRFGRAQFPAVDDYADGVDTLKFLADL
jgi:hypothetical protein